MSVPGQALASLRLSCVSLRSGALPEPPDAPQPSGEGSRPCLRTARGPTAQRGPSSACPRTALVLLGESFCSLFHVGKGAFVRRRRAAALRNRPLRARCARCPPPPRLFRHRGARSVTSVPAPSPAAPRSVIGSRRAEAAPPPCAGGLAGRAGGAWGVWG